MKTEDTPILLASMPEGLIERIKAAEQRIDDGQAPRRIPADPTDVDLVLAEVRLFLEGKSPPFWTPAPAVPASLPAASAWPKLETPARVNGGTFGAGVSSLYVVSAAQSHYENHAAQRAQSPAEQREEEARRRALWDMLHGGSPALESTAADLQGLREALLAPREIVRDACGMLDHPSFPAFDEDVSMRLFLKAFGLEPSFTLMEDDVELEAMEAYDGDCSAWTPTQPTGEGWQLTLIYDTEEGPCAMFLRELKTAPPRRWKNAAFRSEWDAAQAICDHWEVDKALRMLAGDPTGDNATRVVRSVLRRVAAESAPTPVAPSDARWWVPPESFGANWLTNGAALHPHTVDLVVRFARALAAKLAAAEEKYGYSDGWRSADWMDECRAKLLEHVAKGDPRDVAAYCAFLWHHEESTASKGGA